MNPWLRRLLLVLTIGGSFTGMAITLQAGLVAQDRRIMLSLMYGGFIALYGYGIFAGLRFAEKEADQKHLIIFYWLQVPWISSPIIGYRFAAGFHLSGGLMGNQFSGLFRFGSDWQFNFLQPAPWGLGLNAFALIVALLLTIKRHAPPTPPPHLPVNGA